MGTLAYLPKITGNMSLVREMAYTAQFFPASKAEQMGLVSKVVDGGRNEVVAAALNLASLLRRRVLWRLVGRRGLSRMLGIIRTSLLFLRCGTVK